MTKVTSIEEAAARRHLRLAGREPAAPGGAWNAEAGGHAISAPPGGSTDIRDEEKTRLLQCIDTALVQGFAWLRFPAELEQRFESDSLQQRKRSLLLKGLVALVLYDSFLMSDRMMVPDVFQQMLWIRLGLVTPIALIVLFLFTRNPSSRFIESVTAGVSVLVTTSIIYSFASSHHPYSVFYHSGLPLVVMFGNIVQRMRFWHAALTSLGSFVLYLLAVDRAAWIPKEVAFNYDMVFASTVIFTLFANYNLELDERRNYLLNLRERFRLMGLESANQNLARLSELDPLTELPNRRSFERHLNKVWQSCRAQGQPLSMLMLDVDHFKAYNDRLGHPAGDQCLKQIAAAIRNNVRATDELAARVGGEEFAVILPGVPEGRAADVAERIRRAVEDLRIPHEVKSAAGVVTISAGVATAEDTGVRSPQMLIDEADRALYQAKSEGRNRIKVVRSNA
jgi:diguanylate cyclase (GGDEF)-like protein